MNDKIIIIKMNKAIKEGEEQNLFPQELIEEILQFFQSNEIVYIQKGEEEPKEKIIDYEKVLISIKEILDKKLWGDTIKVEKLREVLPKRIEYRIKHVIPDLEKRKYLKDYRKQLKIIKESGKSNEAKREDLIELKLNNRTRFPCRICDKYFTEENKLSKSYIIRKKRRQDIIIIIANCNSCGLESRRFGGFLVW